MNRPQRATSGNGRTSSPRRVEGAAAVVVGMARSGLAATLLLAEKRARVFVSDSGHATALASAIRVLTARGIPHEIGVHSIGCLEGVDFVVVSPGVKDDNPLVIAAHGRGIPIYSELEVASWFTTAPILAVTGANGKTTTTAWLGAIYAAAGREAQVGGNIGRAFADFAPLLSAHERAILEVSSFQLERIETFRPHVAAVLNITPDHLDRHGSMPEYTRLKFRLLENQTPADCAVLNADDPVVVTWDREHHPGHGRRWSFSSHETPPPGVWLAHEHLEYDTGSERGIIPGSERLIPPGQHNRLNAAAAVAVALADGLMPEEIAPGLIHFSGCEHRLEHVADVNGVAFVNDSKATNPDSVAKAIVSFERPLVVIMGGLDKGTDFSPLADDLVRHARALILTGKAAPKLEVELGTRLPYRTAPRFADAFAAAVDTAQPGDVVLLSPGCASFDQFDNYEHRGRVFKQLVAELAGDAGGGS
ncbi:MAG: UDP-N-acetylmuramoyl-L-alanine--D-glutamate ligase [Candidatus Zixiibacteriota bacterium]